LWGYIADRYMADFMPFLIMAGGIGLVDLWRRFAGRRPRARKYLLGGVGVLAAFSVAANVAPASEPNAQWSTYQFRQYLAAQEDLSISSVASTIHHGATLPYYAPAGQMFEVGNCSGLYYSTGESYADVPGQQDQHLTWKPVVQSPDYTHTIRVTIRNPSLPKPVPLLKFGKSTLVLERAGGAKGSYGHGLAQLRIENPGASNITWPSAVSWPFAIKRNYVPWFDVMTDPNLHSIEVRWAGEFMIGHYLAGDGPAVVQVTHATPGGPAPAVGVADVSAQARAISPADPSAYPSDQGLCRSLSHS
jgi:hypothetical protein